MKMVFEISHPSKINQLTLRKKETTGSPLWQSELCHMSEALLTVEGTCLM